MSLSCEFCHSLCSFMFYSRASKSSTFSSGGSTQGVSNTEHDESVEAHELHGVRVLRVQRTGVHDHLLLLQEAIFLFLRACFQKCSEMTTVSPFNRLYVALAVRVARIAAKAYRCSTTPSILSTEQFCLCAGYDLHVCSLILNLPSFSLCLCFTAAL